ncbi:MAG: DEAD/DEAH box helicase, partial [Asticcacaulis sp.]
HKLNWALLIGGVSMADQVAKLDKGVDVLIATPGRLLDLFDRSKVMLNGVQIMVVDEADRMLDMGFIPDIESIFKKTPPNRQTLFFSATMPPEITRLTEQFLRNPVRIEVSRPASTAETITQYVLRVPHKEPRAKRIALRALLKTLDIKNGIVFCNRKSEVDIVAKSLSTHGFNAAPIHGDLDQGLRMKTLDSFRKGDLTLLVASDVAARGLDIPDVGHVFNFDVPHHADDYVHRIGRTGRAGRSGEAYLLLSPADEKNYDKVTKLIKKDPKVLDLDVDYSALSEPERGGGSRSRRDEPRGRSRGGDRPRDSQSSAGRGETPPEAVAEPARSTARRRPSPAKAAIEATVPAETAAAAPPTAAAPAAAKPRQTERQPRKSEDKSGRKTMAESPFGDHMPAFMARGPAVKP